MRAPSLLRSSTFRRGALIALVAWAPGALVLTLLHHQLEDTRLATAGERLAELEQEIVELTLEHGLEELGRRHPDFDDEDLEEDDFEDEPFEARAFEHEGFEGEGEEIDDGERDRNATSVSSDLVARASTSAAARSPCWCACCTRVGSCCWRSG